MVRQTHGRLPQNASGSENSLPCRSRVRMYNSMVDMPIGTMAESGVKHCGIAESDVESGQDCSGAEASEIFDNAKSTSSPAFLFQPGRMGCVAGNSTL